MLGSKIHLIGVGLEKCGTTTAYDILKASPLVMSTSPKETEFYNRNYEKGYEYYRSLYGDTRELSLDITPGYHNDIVTLKRISSYPGSKRIMVFLRDPIHRAFSFYRHDIYYHYSAGEMTEGKNNRVFSDSFARRFLDLSYNYNYYFIDLKKLFDNLHTLFKDDEIIVVYFEEIRNGEFITKIEKSIEIKFEVPTKRLLSHASSANSKPLYKYIINAKHQNGGVLDKTELDDGDLVLYRAPLAPKIWKYGTIDEIQIISALSASQYWTKYVTENQYDEIYERLYKNVDLKSLGLEPDRIFERRALIA